MINVTGVDLRRLVQEAYALSSPQGMGFIHYEPGPLSEEEIDQIVSSAQSHYAVSMDYVKGRAVKLTVHKKDNQLEINDEWYDHTDEQYDELLNRLGVVQ